MNIQDKEIIALWRYGVIAPLIQEISGFSTPSAYFVHVSKHPLTNPVSGVAKVYNKRTIANWYYRYRKMGLDGLMPGDRKDHGLFRALTPEVQKRIDEILEKHPRMPNTKVRAQLKREGLINDSLSQSTVNCYIRAACPQKKLPEIHAGKDRKAFEFNSSNQCWQADTTFLPEINGRKVCLILIIDDASRMVVGYGFFHHDNAVNFLQVLKEAIAVYGKPGLLYMDNRAPYANHQLEMICAQAGISVAHAPVRDGAAKGKIERLNRTLKQGWLSQTDWENFECLTDIRSSFNQYLYPEYINKPHSALVKDDGSLMTPRERFMLDYETIKHIPQEDLDSLFVCRYERNVKTNSTIQVKKVIYDVPSEYMGEKVQVYIDPADDSEAWIGDPATKKRIKIKKLNKVENSSVPRKQHIDYSGKGDQ